MPLFAVYVPHKPVSKTHHHKHVQTPPQTPPKKKPDDSAAARTLLPMSGGTAARTSPPATTGGGAVVVQSAGNQGQTGNAIVLVPNDAQTAGSSASSSHIGQPGGSHHPGKIQWVHENYFDAGAEDLIGTFTTLVLRYGIRVDQNELHVYFRNETLNTTGTNLPYQSIIEGSSVGVGYRYWFPGNHYFFTVSDGYYFSGYHDGSYDFRVGMVGYWDWRNEKVFTDIYSDLFYIDLAKDTFLTARLRSGPILFKNRTGEIIAYGVGQLFASGSGSNGTENRAEVGYGIGYVFEHKISLNVEMRAGYAFRGIINNREYLNPMIVLAGSL